MSRLHLDKWTLQLQDPFSPIKALHQVVVPYVCHSHLFHIYLHLNSYRVIYYLFCNNYMMSEVTTSAEMLPNQSGGPQVSKPVRVGLGCWLSIYLENKNTTEHNWTYILYSVKIGRSLAGRSKERRTKDSRTSNCSTIPLASYATSQGRNEQLFLF
jgi:hypothetical protein